MSAWFYLMCAGIGCVAWVLGGMTWAIGAVGVWCLLIAFAHAVG